MRTNKYKQFITITSREDALRYFRSKRAYYDRKTKLYECQGDNCGRKMEEHLVIDDHINNDPSDNRPSNHQPLCKSCNTHNSGKSDYQMKKVARQRRKALDNGINQSNGLSAQITINRIAEEPFRSWCLEQVKVYQSIGWLDLIDAGCEYVTQNFVNLSQHTAEKYLRKLTSFTGPLIASGVGDARMVELRNKAAAENSSGPS